jgi:hypothetical protein
VSLHPLSDLHAEHKGWSANKKAPCRNECMSSNNMDRCLKRVPHMVGLGRSCCSA